MINQSHGVRMFSSREVLFAWPYEIHHFVHGWIVFTIYHPDFRLFDYVGATLVTNVAQPTRHHTSFTNFARNWRVIKKTYVNYRTLNLQFGWFNVRTPKPQFWALGDDWDGEQRMEGWGCGEWSELKAFSKGMGGILICAMIKTWVVFPWGMVVNPTHSHSMLFFLNHSGWIPMKWDSHDREPIPMTQTHRGFRT